MELKRTKKDLLKLLIHQGVCAHAHGCLHLLISDISEVKVAHLYLTLCNPMDSYYSSVHGIFQARVLEWVAISFSRGSSRPRDQTQVSRIVGRHFTI